MLSTTAKRGLQSSLKLGCFLKLLPYRWNDETIPRLLPATKRGINCFHLHQYVMTSYSVFMIYRFTQATLQLGKSGNFPLQQLLLSALWTNAFVLTSVGFIQLDLRRNDIMNYANFLLSFAEGGHQPSFPHSIKTSKIKTEFPKLQRIDRKGRKSLSWHVYVALFLLYSNPGVHTLIQYQSPCAPHFISSSILKCRFIAENVYTVLEKGPFAVFEFYTIFMFLYICAFHWSFIMFGLTFVTTELRKMKDVTIEMVSRFGRWNSIFFEFRQLQLLVNMINDIFRYYLMVFPSILFFIVSMLMFGTIRLWHTDPQSNVMFPLCGLRCGFEAVTPLEMAGRVSEKRES